MYTTTAPPLTARRPRIRIDCSDLFRALRAVARDWMSDHRISLHVCAEVDISELYADVVTARFVRELYRHMGIITEHHNDKPTGSVFVEYDYPYTVNNGNPTIDAQIRDALCFALPRMLAAAYYGDIAPYRNRMCACTTTAANTRIPAIESR